MTEAELLAALHDIQAPDTAAGGAPGDLLAAAAVALVLALLGARALRPVLRQRRAVATGDAAAPSDPDARALALMRRLKAVAPERVEAFRDALYRPDVELDEDAVRRILDAAGKRRGHA